MTVESLGRGTLAHDHKTVEWCTTSSAVKEESRRGEAKEQKQHEKNDLPQQQETSSAKNQRDDDDNSPPSRRPNMMSNLKDNRDPPTTTDHDDLSKRPLVVPMTSTPDVYGQIHPIESPELLSAALETFHHELRRFLANDDNNKKTEALRQAEAKCPELLTDEFKLQFLRAEVFNVKLAIQRYVRYWEQRLHIFGPHKAFQPLTLEGALCDDVEILRLGVVQVCPKTDVCGRSMALMTPSRLNRKQYTVQGMARVFWYLFHVMLEPVSAQRHGIMILYCLRGFHWTKHMDRALAKRVMPSIQGAIPARCSAVHIFQPPATIQLVIPILSVLVLERIKKRVLFHTGSRRQNVIQTVETKFGLPPDCLPTQLGGTLELMCIHRWINQRQADGK